MFSALMGLRGQEDGGSETQVNGSFQRDFTNVQLEVFRKHYVRRKKKRTWFRLALGVG